MGRHDDSTTPRLLTVSPWVVAGVLFGVSVGACLLSIVTYSYAYLVAPACGIITIAYSGLRRASGQILVGIGLAAMPIALYFMLDYNRVEL